MTARPPDCTSQGTVVRSTTMWGGPHLEARCKATQGYDDKFPTDQQVFLATISSSLKPCCDKQRQMLSYCIKKEGNVASARTVLTA